MGDGVGDAVTGLEVRPVRAGELDGLLPLFAGYQRFYGAEPDDARNAAFFRRFLGPSGDGLLLAAWSDGSPVGFACCYWTFSSTRAAEVVLMNDLFVAESARGRGVGLALIRACADAARTRGAAQLEWLTAADNHRAQRLYERTGAARAAWLGYELEVEGEPAPTRPPGPPGSSP